MPSQGLGYLTDDMNNIKDTLEGYAAHLRPLDRMRLNGVGIKKQGFIQRAYDLAVENPEFRTMHSMVTALPHH
jgi:hypothetical protein